MLQLTQNLREFFFLYNDKETSIFLLTEETLGVLIAE
jgi:hypothetical protein